jgi:hypothetical protein
VVIIESDGERRAQLRAAFQASGIPVVAVESIVELERWPAGDLVVTDFDRFTTWWKHVGATHVIVLADSPAQGVDACSRGATAWIPRISSLDALVAAVCGLADAGTVETSL